MEMVHTNIRGMIMERCRRIEKVVSHDDPPWWKYQLMMTKPN
jgi:hypothetical protein